jgi:hypothetical protein
MILEKISTKFPKLYSLFLLFMFTGVMFAWLILILPFYIYDHLIEDFRIYFQCVKDHWNK